MSEDVKHELPGGGGVILTRPPNEVENQEDATLKIFEKINRTQQIAQGIMDRSSSTN